MVGTGIFLLPGQIAGVAGGMAWLAYIACGLLCFLIALCFAEMGSRYERTGGAYIYALDAFGPFFGFLVGWTVWMSAIMGWASVAVGLVNGIKLDATADGAGWIRLGLLVTMVGVLALLNIRGARLGAAANNLFSVAKLLPLGVFVLWGSMHTVQSPFAPPPHWTGPEDFTKLMLWSIFLFSGFEDMPVPAGETRDAQRAVPRALFIVLGTATVIYLAVHLVAQATFTGLATSTTTPLRDAAAVFMGAAGVTLIAGGAVIAQFGTTASIALTGPRSLYALARDRFIPQRFARVHPRWHTPVNAIVISAVLVVLMPLVDHLHMQAFSFDNLVALSALGSLLQYIATCAAVIVMRLRRDAPAPAFRIAGGLLIPILALAFCITLMVQAPPGDRNKTLIGLGVGACVYATRRWWSGGLLDADQLDVEDQRGVGRNE